jgi:hypothetical protein
VGDLKVRTPSTARRSSKASTRAASEANCGYVIDRLVPQGIEPYAYDPEKAKALLTEAGWDKINGDKLITWLTYYTNPLATNVMAAIQAMLAQVGINVVRARSTLPLITASSWPRRRSRRSFRWSMPVSATVGPEPTIGLNEKQMPPVGNNFLHIREPDLNTALDAALADGRLKRDARYQDVCKAMNAHLPWATMWVAKLWRRFHQAEGFRLDAGSGGGPFDTDAEKCWRNSREPPPWDSRSCAGCPAGQVESVAGLRLVTLSLNHGHWPCCFIACAVLAIGALMLLRQRHGVRAAHGARRSDRRLYQSQRAAQQTEMEVLRARLGLDQPLPMQYLLAEGGGVGRSRH